MFESSILGYFPFGQPLYRTPPQRPTGPARAFVLGVYSSAVHALWEDPNGKCICRALAVASEPHAFWDGADAENRIREVARTVPEALGRLKPPSQQFNGPSGRALNEEYLKPLGLDPTHLWITDVHNAYFLSEGNAEVIRGEYAERTKGMALSPVDLPARPKKVQPSQARLEELRAEFKRADTQWVITLGNEALAAVSESLPKLRHNAYGEPVEAEAFGRKVRLLALCHPRQAGQLGQSSGVWRATHRKWKDRIVAAGGVPGLSPR